MKLLCPVRSFHNWLFSEGDPTSLGLLRIVFGTISFLVLLVQKPLLTDFYGEIGLLPAPFLALWQWKGEGFNPLLLMNLEQIHLFFAFSLLVTVLFAIGLFSRIMGWLTFLCLLAFNMRNPLLLNSGDVLLRVVVCYLAISQCGARLSVDSYLRRRRGLPQIDRVALFPQRLIQLQIALVYCIAILHKVEGTVWLDGTALWYVTRIEELARFSPPEFMMGETFTKIGTWGTLLIQSSLFTLVWFRKYRWVLLGGVMLHAAIDIQMNIPFFSMITVSCYLSFFDGEEWSRFMRGRLHEIFRFASTRTVSSSNA